MFLENIDFLLIFFLLNLEKNLEDTEVVCYKIEGLKISVFSLALNHP